MTENFQDLVKDKSANSRCTNPKQDKIRKSMPNNIHNQFQKTKNKEKDLESSLEIEK